MKCGIGTAARRSQAHDDLELFDINLLAALLRVFSGTEGRLVARGKR